MANKDWRDRLVAAGFLGLRATRLHRIAGAGLRGLGAILMFHRVRPQEDAALRMNRGLSVTPDFLCEAIETLSELGFAIVSLDQALSSLAQGGGGHPFAALTFDDGYRDILEYAEPVLRRYGAPYAIYVTPGFADGAVRAWWDDLEAAIKALPRVTIRLADSTLDLPARDRAEKNAAADLLCGRLRALPGPEARAAATSLLDNAGVGRSRDFLTWEELRQLAASPLCAIGAHTLTHPSLARLDPFEARREIEESRRRIESEIGRPARHFAYPYGSPVDASLRDFELARAAGFASAVTTRPGMIFREHAGHPWALPRLSVNGAWQSRPAFEALLSGLPFAFWNRGRRLNVA